MDGGLKLIPAQSLLSNYSENRGWFGMHYNMNIYKGCCHGCIYCDSRSDCYGVETFDAVRAKANAHAMLDRELRARRRRGVVGTGSMSDPYNPFEEESGLTRGALRLLEKHGFGVGLATKSDLVTRDVDMLQRIQVNAPVLVQITITTISDRLAKQVEPYAPPPSRRLAAVNVLRQAGIPVCVLMLPVLPFIEDDPAQLSELMYAVAENGANYFYCLFGVTLRGNQRQYFFNRLEERFPGMKDRYIKQYGTHYECRSPQAQTLWKRMEGICRETGMLYRMEDIIRDYQGAYRLEQTKLPGV